MSDREQRRRARIEAERARRRRQRRASRRTPVVVAVAAVTAVAAGGAFLATRGGDDEGDERSELAAIGREGSVIVPDADPVELAEPASTARVVYRVETAGEEVSVLTDVLSVRRPFESRMETKLGEPPGGDSVSSRIGWYLHTATVGGGAQPSLLEVAPGAPPTDLRLDAVLPVALEHELIERREVRRVAGRECQVYRSLQTLAARVQPPTDDEHADTCVDAAGLVLEEVVTVDGDVLTRRVAVEVDESPSFDDGLFRADGTPVEAAAGGGFVRRVKDGSTPPGEFFVVDAPPAGAQRLGLFSVVPPQPENFGDDPLRESSRRAAVVEAWQRGGDIIAVEQGGTLRGAAPFEPTPGVPKVTVASFGEAELLVTGSGIELRVVRDGGRYVRLYGTVPPDELIAVASSMRQVPGGTLELEDAPAADQP